VVLALAPSFFVMAGLDPAIHVERQLPSEDMDARVKPGHDDIL
jgi:hypothetical protein